MGGCAPGNEQQKGFEIFGTLTNGDTLVQRATDEQEVVRIGICTILFLRPEVLIAERWRSWNRNYIKSMFGCLMAGVTSGRKHRITVFKCIAILLPDSFIYTL